MGDAFKLFADFSLISGLSTIVIDKTGKNLYTTGFSTAVERLLSVFVDIFSDSHQFEVALIYAGYQSHRFGGRYIFTCPRGFTYFACPLLNHGEMYASVISGPLLMVEHEEFIEIDLVGNRSVSKENAQKLSQDIYSIPYRTPVHVRALSEQLFVNASFSNSSYSYQIGQEQVNMQLKTHISQYISQVKNQAGASFYPLDKENALLEAMSRGDTLAAKALLNEILGHVLFQSGGDLETMRSRVVELIVLLSRATVKGGADAQKIFGLNYSYMQEIDTFSNSEDIILWLNNIMNRFTKHVFDYAGVKHGGTIYKAIDYISSNYMQKLTLEDVAAIVYLSPTYFSKIFKEETGHGFNTYLNNLRIEQSKIILADQRINLVDVASLVGYEDQSYFSKVFKKIEGITPGRYRSLFANNK